MRSLQRRFSYTIKKNPYWSSYICFAVALIKQDFNRQTIHRWFNKLVEKDDYDKKVKKAILAQLVELTKPLEDNKKSGHIIAPLH